MLAGKGKNRSIYVCIASTINLFIFFGGDAPTLFLTQLIAEEPLIAPIIGDAALYFTDSVLFENDALNG